MKQSSVTIALKYEGWTYVYGGASPTTSFDCSGLVQWVYNKAGISLPRVASQQYEATEHIPLSEAKAGDLVFFHSTYDAYISTKIVCSMQAIRLAMPTLQVPTGNSI